MEGYGLSGEGALECFPRRALLNGAVLGFKSCSSLSLCHCQGVGEAVSGVGPSYGQQHGLQVQAHFSFCPLPLSHVMQGLLLPAPEAQGYWTGLAPGHYRLLECFLFLFTLGLHHYSVGTSPGLGPPCMPSNQVLSSLTSQTPVSRKFEFSHILSHLWVSACSERFLSRRPTHSSSLADPLLIL